MQDAPKEVQDLFAKLIGDLNRQTMQQETDRAKADPLGHKLTRVMEKPMSYRYVSAGKDGRGRFIRFCWTCHRNVAGFFLGWREVTSKRQVKRDHWLSRRTRRRVEEVAERRATAFRRRRAESAFNPPLPPVD